MMLEVRILISLVIDVVVRRMSPGRFWVLVMYFLIWLLAHRCSL